MNFLIVGFEQGSTSMAAGVGVSMIDSKAIIGRSFSFSDGLRLCEVTPKADLGLRKVLSLLMMNLETVGVS